MHGLAIHGSRTKMTSKCGRGWTRQIEIHIKQAYRVDKTVFLVFFFFYFGAPTDSIIRLSMPTCVDLATGIQ